MRRRLLREFLIEREMKSSYKIVLVVVLMLFAGFKGYSQTVTQKVDSLQIREKQGQTTVNADKQNQKGNAYGQTNRNNATKSVKQVRGGRPDMSRAKGARPPMIVRPSGSGIPKGVGKPGGVGRKGGR
jgi:uncharacterized protein YlxW (UPF0749 family)